MNKSRTTGNRFSRALGRMGALVLVFALFSIQQAWAGITCMCNYHRYPTSGPCSHRKSEAETQSMAHNHNAAMHHSQDHSSEIPAMHHSQEHSSGDQVMTAGQGINSIPRSFSCCHGQPQAELLVISFSMYKIALIGDAPATIAPVTAQSLLSINIHGPPRHVQPRPLYISLSSLLI